MFSGEHMQNWIEWKGGDCPVDPETWVEIKCRGGHTEVAQAGGFNWDDSTISAHDIVAYRVTEPTKVTNPKDVIGDTKVPMWLLSPIAKAHWALGQYAGLLKYGAWNWRAAGVRSSVYISAMERHLEAYKSGEEYDPVDGSHHLGNIMACAAILLDARAAGKLIDDRPPSVGVRPTFAFVERVMKRLKGQYADKKPRHWDICDPCATVDPDREAS